jgi:hypothetical protein
MSAAVAIDETRALSDLNGVDLAESVFPLRSSMPVRILTKHALAACCITLCYDIALSSRSQCGSKKCNLQQYIYSRSSV